MGFLAKLYKIHAYLKFSILLIIKNHKNAFVSNNTCYTGKLVIC